MIKIVKRIIKWTGIYRKRVYLGFLFAMLDSMCGALPIMIGAIALNLILKDINGEIVLTSKHISLTLLALIILVLGKWLFTYLRCSKQESIAYELTADERLELGDVLKRVPLGFFKNKTTGELTTAVTTDLSFFEMHGMNMIDLIVNSYIYLGVCIICFIFFEPSISLICLLGIVGSSIGLYLLEKHSKKNAPVHQKCVDDMAAATLEYIRGLQVVKSFKQEGVAAAGIRNSYKKARDINIKIEKEFSLYNIVHCVALYTSTVAIMLICSLLTIEGKMEIPIMVMLVLFGFVMFNSIETVNNALHVLEVIDVAMDKLETIKEAEFIDKDGKNISINNYDINFKNVSFGYDTQEVIKNVSFSIPQNTTTAIIGPSGSGKTTLCNLIARFYDVDNGSITVGGHNVKEFTCNSLLSNISMVFQNVYLFHDTIMNNIKFGNPKATDEEVYNAARKARCHDFIKSFSDGYNTVIGEGGSSLSGGEKQRISIARAILKDAAIVILDEATASIDPENEQYIQEAISALTNGKTIITIAHRLATIESADQIIVIDDGKVVQQGNHDALLNEEGIYKKFYDIRNYAENWNIA